MKIFKFYGAESNRFRLDDTFWEAIEDEDDGYRSLLDTIEVVNKNKIDKTLLYDSPIAYVYVRETKTGEFNGYELVDVADGHIWLSIGTADYDEYYPYFVFRYTPPLKFDIATMTWKDFIKGKKNGILEWTVENDEGLYDSIEVLKNQEWIAPYDHIENAIRKLCMLANIEPPDNLGEENK